MKNVDMKVQGDKLVITVSLKERHGPSSSGKTEIVASTEGNLSVPDHPEIKIGLNLYTKPAAK